MALLLQATMLQMHSVVDGIVEYVGILAPHIDRDLTLRSAAHYGLGGVLEFYKAKLKDIHGYAPLRSGVFQHFKELGNLVCLADMLDEQVRVAVSGVQGSLMRHVCGGTWELGCSV